MEMTLRHCNIETQGGSTRTVVTSQTHIYTHTLSDQCQLKVNQGGAGLAKFG